MKDKSFEQLKEELLNLMSRIYIKGKLAGMEEIQKLIEKGKND